MVGVGGELGADSTASAVVPAAATARARTSTAVRVNAMSALKKGRLEVIFMRRFADIVSERGTRA
jgi:hypothetical protein